MKRNLLSVALASATLMLATGVHAQTVEQAETQDATSQQEEEAEVRQDDAATTLDRVTVTGIRRGIEDAIETKRESTSIVESISSEDIGKLPDTSIADSIARLPGLTAQRFGGRPQEINIRGFSGDFSTTLLNGREQVSLGNNRGVEFDQYPSELINQVVVYKTQDASLVGQGLSGTVDLRTVRPLEFGERAIAVNLRGDMNELNGNEEYGNRLSISYIDQFADNTIGLALGYARLDNPVQGHQFESWGYDNGVLGGGKLYDIQNDNQRDGFMGVLEYKPNDMYSSRLDVFYSKFDKEETRRGMEFGLAWGSAGQPVSRTNNANGTAVQATFENFDPVIRNDYNAAADDLFAIGWNHEFQLSDHWRFTADISHSGAQREERVLETYSGLAAGLAGDTVGISLNPEGFFDFDFGYDYGDPSILRLTDAGGWGQDGYVKDFEVQDDLTAVRFDLERTFDAGAISSLEFGANLTDRTKSRASDEAFLCLRADCERGLELPIPTNLATTTSFDFAGLTSLYGYDALAALNSLYFRRPNLNNGDINNKNWEVHEKVVTAYVQANLDFDVGSVPIRGNVGVQAISADQDSEGFQSFPGNGIGADITGGANYTDYLPSLNLKAEFPSDLFVRFGAGRQVARPRMDQMRAAESVSFDPNRAGGNGFTNGLWSRNGGNPELEPWLADAFDLSVEKYFGGKGYISAGYFYKDLKSYIHEEVVPFDIRDFADVYPPAQQPPNSIGANPIGEYRRPINGEGGTLDGFELAVSLPFEMIWAPLEGFGLQANYSEVSSSIQPNGPGTSEPLPGLSKYVSNATLYFERWGFSARVSQRSRSDFRGEVQGFGGDRVVRNFEGEKIVDAQVGYTFQSGALENFSLLLQVNNIENEPFRSTDNGASDRPREFFEFGRTFLFGVNYRF
ncbi:MAG: TonB-dependent receptor [Pseudomonadota bacterium]|nr:TonB-dependent receptor [Pseudomonadota bacterium]